ncbi:hypothetical protein ASE22_25645 [Sphingomonas sp. Root720]|nr:hypothetical protein ASE22_25645 [Sphingomonas sp. Root720]
MPPTPRPAISNEERSRREQEVGFARGSVHFKGGVLSEAVEQLSARYVGGEIDSDELTAAILVAESTRTTAITR